MCSLRVSPSRGTAATAAAFIFVFATDFCAFLAGETGTFGDSINAFACFLIVFFGSVVPAIFLIADVIREKNPFLGCLPRDERLTIGVRFLVFVPLTERF